MTSNLMLQNRADGSLKNYPRQDDRPILDWTERDKWWVLKRQTEDSVPQCPTGYRLVEKEKTVFTDKNSPHINGILLSYQEAEPIPPPVYDWPSFSSVFFAPPDELNEEWVAILAVLAASSQLALFVRALESLANNGGEHIAASIYWQAILKEVNLSAEQIELIKEQADACALPSQFVFFLGGVPEAEDVGQEWRGPDGVLWRVIQRTNPDGTFASDDPATAQRESLEWARVEEG